MTGSLSLNINCGSLSKNDPTSPIYLVAVYAGDGAIYVARSSQPGTNLYMKLDIPWGKQAIADNLLSKYDNFQYAGFTANDAIIPSTIKLGDTIRIGDLYAAVYGIHIDAGALLLADLSAPENNL